MTKEELNNLYLSIKTICYVTRHMEKEISCVDFITKNNSETFHRNNPIDINRKKHAIKRAFYLNTKVGTVPANTFSTFDKSQTYIRKNFHKSTISSENSYDYYETNSKLTRKFENYNKCGPMRNRKFSQTNDTFKQFSHFPKIENRSRVNEETSKYTSRNKLHQDSHKDLFLTDKKTSGQQNRYSILSV